jgi:hypothetical protein
MSPNWHILPQTNAAVYPVLAKADNDPLKQRSVPRSLTANERSIQAVHTGRVLDPR